MNDDAKMSFLEHLEELRRRLIICITSVFVGMIICWFFRDQILSFLLEPLYHAWRQVDGLEEPRPLNYSSMLEPFVANLKLSAMGGLFLSAPVVLYQLWSFISPGLYPKERRMALPFVLVSTLLFVGGSMMAYSMVFPIGFRFFLEFASGQDMSSLSREVNLPVVEDTPAPPALPTKRTEKQEPAVQAPSTSQKTPEPTHQDAGPDASVPDSTPSLVAESVEKNGESATDKTTPKKTTASSNKSVAKEPSSDSPMIGGRGDFQNSSAATNEKNILSKKEATNWLESLMRRIFTSDCATFMAYPSESGKSATLTVEWQKARCGQFAEVVIVRRDGKRLAPSWTGVAADQPGAWIYTANDPIPPGKHRYDIRYPSNPNANRLAPVLMVKDYLAFAVRILLAFGLIFELPILISFLAIAGIVNYKQLISFFRYFFVVAVIIGALLTPPDVITQLLLAAPLMLLYSISILVAYLFGERPDKDE